MPGSPATSSGYTSITFTTQSESVPLVEATRFATGCPLIFTGAVNGSVTKTSTSGRPESSRWSSTSHFAHSSPLSAIGRERNGTGLAGSETYSSNSGPTRSGAANPALRPAPRYNGVGRIAQSAAAAQPDGHAARCRHVLLPVSYAVTGEI